MAEQTTARAPTLQRWLATIDWGLIAAACFALPLIVPFLHSGLPATADAENHLHRIISVLTSFENGYLWPRWTPYLYQGFGYPLHNFHPPGTYVVQALFYLVTHLDIRLIFMLSQFGMTLLYPLGAYLFARTFTGRAGALVAAAAFTFAPFRFLELWVQTDLPQFAAMMTIPWLLWAIARGAQRKRLPWVIVIGVWVTALTMSHHATTFFVAPFAGLYTLLMIYVEWRESGWKAARQASIITIGGLLFGVALSTVYWLPALTELSYIQIHTIQDTMLGIQANFLPISQLISGVVPIDRTLFNWTYAYAAGGPRAGLPQLLAVIVGLLVLLPRVRGSYRLKINVVAGVLTTAFCLFLITPQSDAIWNVLPLASLLQYPWRLLGNVAAFVIPGAAALPALVPLRWRSRVAFGAVVIFFVASMPLLYAPLRFDQLPPATQATEIAHEIASGNLGLTSTNEYLPKWVTARPLFSFATPAMKAANAAALQTHEWHVWIDDRNLPDGTTITPLASAPLGTNRYTIQTPTAFTLTFHQMYYPGWQVQIDGQDAPLQPISQYGLISTPLAAGTHDVTIRYEGTTTQHIADWVSVISVFAALLALVGWQWVNRKWRNRRDTSEEAEPGAPLLAVAVIGAVLAFIVVNQTVLIPDTSLFRPTSDINALPIQHPLHETFGQTIELLGYDLDTTRVHPNQSVTVILYWRLLQPTKQGLRAALTLTNLDGSQLWGQVLSYNIGRVSTNNWTMDQYVVDNYSFTVSPDALPFIGDIRVSVFPQVDTTNIEYLKTSEGLTDAVIGQIAISGDLKTVQDSQLNPVNVTFGGNTTLIGYVQQTNPSGQACLIFRWHVQQAFTDSRVMLHFQDQTGKILGVADAPPFNGQYPTTAWQAGQTLDDSHCVDAPVGTTSIAVALYTMPDVQRLNAVNASGQAVQDNTVIIPFQPTAH